MEIFTVASGNVQLAVGSDANGNAAVCNCGGGMEIKDSRVLFRFIPLNEALGLSALSSLPAVHSQLSTYYDLYGRRVAHPRHGIYINASGRKVIL
ncbi:MAG: hypothetical protein NC301_07160 [Bacteroides sp.]|nr:hypothetical protein [Bacteroides sp.]MCM1379150.1 hypothetical protein [Bacteroides sp.]MCM1445344.1 hypothetical protein [Prevotella sp.]